MFRERYLSEQELAAFMDAVRRRGIARDYALFAVLANTGIRPTEALSLTRADVHVHARLPWIRVTRLKKRKAVPESDDIELSSDVAAVLATHVATVPDHSDARVFPLNRRTIQKTFKLYARRAGLWRGFHLYTLRHTAATRVYVATRDITIVQAMLGHENPDTSCIYAHVPYSMLVDIANTMPTCL